MKSLPDQFAEVAATYLGATLTSPSGLPLVILPAVPLPDGWCKPSTHVRFVVPNGYPYAAPDCFWADYDLRLAAGQLPKNAVIGNVMAGQPEPNLLWFSWHVARGAWNPAKCDLMTYVAIIRRRFEEIS